MNIFDDEMMYVEVYTNSTWIKVPRKILYTTSRSAL